MPKVWLALFFGYNGTNFQGMQYQKDQTVQSIEKLIVHTLFKQGFLTTKNYPQLSKNYKFGRAARTDKGVHAILNCVSCMFTVPQKFYDESNLLKKDQLLVKFKLIFENTDLVIHSIKRVTCRFDIRTMVKSRTYCYLCPIAYFAKSKQQQQKALLKINECCKKFIGTHNFHNYSKNLRAKDPKAQRYIIQFGCQKINEKWLKFTIKGQSFVYHQIRKIIGSIIHVFMSEYEPQFISNTFFNNQFYVPLAPPFGLYLKSLSFQSYNKKLQIPQKIEFSEQKQSIQKLESVIIKHIQGIDEKHWHEWEKQVREGVVPKFQDDEESAIDDG